MAYHATTTTRFEWKGNPLLLFVLSISIALIPFAIVHFITSLKVIQETRQEPSV